MKKQKMPNIEALRCLAMMMVVVLHYLGKGKLLHCGSQCLYADQRLFLMYVSF